MVNLFAWKKGDELEHLLEHHFEELRRGCRNREAQVRSRDAGRTACLSNLPRGDLCAIRQAAASTLDSFFAISRSRSAGRQYWTLETCVSCLDGKLVGISSVGWPSKADRALRK